MVKGTYIVFLVGCVCVLSPGCDDGAVDNPSQQSSHNQSDSDANDSSTSSTTATDVTDEETTSTVSGEGTVVLNELAAAGVPDDWIELLNIGDNPVDLGGWFVSDSAPEHLHEFALGTILDPGVHLLLLKDETGGFSFGLGKEDEVHLYDASGVEMDWVAWANGQSPDEMSYGRIPDGTGTFTTLANPTPGVPNAANPSLDCGNDSIEFGESCDGTLLAGETCESLGLATGNLACDSDCDGFDLTGCVAMSRQILINEVSSSGEDPIELFNPGDEDIDLEGWTLTDKNDEPADGAYTFLPDTVPFRGGHYLLLFKDQHHLFGLGASDTVKLRNASGELVDKIKWSKGEAEHSYCLSPNGGDQAMPCAEASFGEENP